MKELFDKLSFPPKVSLWITIASLAFVLLNNHLYLSGIQDREEKLVNDEAKLELREQGNAKKERMMRLWEMELINREKELTKILEEIKLRQKHP